MSLFLVGVVVFLGFFTRCNCFCGEGEKVGSPKVNVADSTHLRVSWHELFPGSCGEVDHMDVVAEDHKEGSSETFPAQFDAKEVLVSLDPCLGFSIFLRIFFDDKINKFLNVFESEIVKYNAMSPTPNIHTVYGGLLEEVGFLQNICLKGEEGEMSIPDPPEEVSKCVLNILPVDNENETGQSHVNLESAQRVSAI